MSATPVSHLNAIPDVTAGTDPPTRLSLNDVTLREGEQSAGVTFPTERKVALARMLADAGVAQIQVGYPGRFERDGEAVAAIAAALPELRLEVVALAFVEDWEAEVDACLAVEAQSVHVVFRASDRLHRLLGVTREEALARIEASVGRAVAGGADVSFSPSDTTRADLAFLRDAWAAAAAAGARRVYIADSMGAATPQLIAHLVSVAREAGAPGVGVHCHDDFGLGVANTLAGVLAGADTADSAVNGLGDRAGNACTEEVVAALELLYGVETGVRLGALTELSRAFASASGRAIPPNKPLTGPDVFTHTLPTHVAAIRADPLSIQPIAAELVGNLQRIESRP